MLGRRRKIGLAVIGVLLAATTALAANHEATTIRTPTSSLIVAQAPSQSQPAKPDVPKSSVVPAVVALVTSGNLVEAYEIARKAPADDAKLAAWIEQNAAHLYAPFLYELARRLQRTDPAAAAKWSYAGTLWARYDARRCKDRTAAQGVPVLAAGLEPLVAWARDHRAEDVAAAEAALAWERDHPSRRVSPAWICVHGIMAYQAQAEGRKLQPADWLVTEAEWPNLRDRARAELAGLAAKRREEARSPAATDGTEATQGGDVGYAFRRVATLKAGFGITKIAWSRDGRLIAAGGPLGGKIAVFDVAAKKIISHINTRSIGGGHFLFTADGKKLVTADLNREVDGQQAVAVVWEVESGDKLKVLTRPPGPESDYLRTVADRMMLTPDGRQLVISYDANRGVPAFGVYDTGTWQLRRAFGPPFSGTSALAMSPDGRHIAAGTYKGEVEIWDFHSGEKVRSFVANAGVVRGLTFTRTGKALITAGEDSEKRTNSETRRMEWVKFNPLLRNWDPTTGALVQTKVYQPKYHIKNLASGEHNELVAFTYGGEIAMIHNIDTLQTSELQPAIKYISSLAFSFDGSRIAAGGDDNVVIWHLERLRKSTGQK